MNAPVNVTVRIMMPVVSNYQSQSSASGLWAQVILKDSNIFEGIVVQEQVHGLYLSIGGSDDRLSLFPWHTVDRVIYKDLV